MQLITLSLSNKKQFFQVKRSSNSQNQNEQKLRRGGVSSYMEYFLLVSKFNVTPYFQLKKARFFKISDRFSNNAGKCGLPSMKNSIPSQNTPPWEVHST